MLDGLWFIIVVVMIGLLVLGAVLFHDFYEERIRDVERNWETCQEHLAETQHKLSQVTAQRDQLARENESLRTQLAGTEDALGKTKASLGEARQALAGDYLINATIALGLVILGAAIGLSIPFVLYVGGIITVTERGE